MTVANNTLVQKKSDANLSSFSFKSLNLDPKNFNVEDFWQAIDHLENTTGAQFIRMDFGVPGLRTLPNCIDVQKSNISNGITARAYPPHIGTESLRREMSVFINDRTHLRFTKNNLFATCGGTQALYVAQALAIGIQNNKDSILYLTPGYPPMLSQGKSLGKKILCIDTTFYRDNELVEQIQEHFAQHKIAAIVWASPSNPLWSILSPKELSAIAQLCEKYQVTPIEDMTYLGMLTQDNGNIFKIPSIGQFTSKYLMVFSSSKILSYAGERIGLIGISDGLQHEIYPDLEHLFSTQSIQKACATFIFNTTAGAPHSAQHAVADTLKKINNREINIELELNRYSTRSKFFKKLLTASGFTLLEQKPPLANHKVIPLTNVNHLNPAHSIYLPNDGFYVCFYHKNYTSFELTLKLLNLGITVLPLSSFHSGHTQGVRACVGRASIKALNQFKNRLHNF